MSYDVVLLIEQALTRADAERVWSLHQSVEGPVRYHVLIPMEDAAARVESAMGNLGGGDLMGAPAMQASEVDFDAVRNEARDYAQQELDDTLEHFKALEIEATGEIVIDPPIDRLKTKLEEVDGREAIILTRSHVVAEFFHVDWTSKARRKIGVPVLHLLEHENFDEQAH
ncbi:hypothetical protein [Nocardioides insulae]|uniref:hypothetical protein n=1 Tax=Nocardioides insulae TaxID=394734 RepID=UPI0003FEFB5D|nr:hypothetical protein [Nocardioides insulae]